MDLEWRSEILSEYEGRVKGGGCEGEFMNVFCIIRVKG